MVIGRRAVQRAPVQRRCPSSEVDRKRRGHAGRPARTEPPSWRGRVDFVHPLMSTLAEARHVDGVVVGPAPLASASIGARASLSSNDSNQRSRPPYQAVAANFSPLFEGSGLAAWSMSFRRQSNPRESRSRSD